MKEALIILLSFIIGFSLTYQKAEKVEVIQSACVETHQTLNRNETQIVCGKLLPSNKGD